MCGQPEEQLAVDADGQLKKQKKNKKRKERPVAPSEDHRYNFLSEDEVIQDLIARGAIFAVNDSGGKDSQLMKLKILAMVPHNQILVVHADLGQVEWAGVEQHVLKYTPSTVAFRVARNPNKDFVDMVHLRQKFPDKDNRQCTSDLKRCVIETQIRRFLKKHGKFLVVNCMGLRAEESTDRKTLQTFTFHKGNSLAGREWYDWLPIHKVPTAEVIPAVEAAGQKVHWAYYKGMSRLSCMFCIMANQSDLRISAILNPEHYDLICSLEEHYNFSLQMGGKRLPEITGIPFNRVDVKPRTPEQARAVLAMLIAADEKMAVG